MAVKRIQSAARVLTALEGIARHQPIGVSALARLLGDDKSAVQRAIMTLADEGWIRAAAGSPVKWELTAHIHAVAHMGHGSNNLRQRARPALRALRDEFDETVLLTMPDVGKLVLIEVVESHQMLRYVAPIGATVDARDSAAGRAILPYMSGDRQAEFLGGPPDAELLEDFAATLRRGYSISANLMSSELTNIAAAIREVDGQPAAAVVLSGPSARITPDRYAEIGMRVSETARSLSHGPALQ
jgi:IclR family acetate operon transcriptional repressor